ncbi:MAG: aldo/keto reductase [Candidatus Marinimicrobia bacterium]|nr:aldo/keto reductase [Candidatus Neomarinimicrobiota bacterium]
MQYRDFGHTGVKLSALGMGCMRLPVIDGDINRINEKKAVALIRRAIDGGVNYVDTAWGYHGGNSEALVGRALKDGYREKVFLATKLPCYLIEKREDMDHYLNKQLERLDTDHIDFYLLHALNSKTWKTVRDNGVFEFIEAAKKDGRIRYIGFSFHDDYPVFEGIINSYDWDFCQIQYNIIDEDFQAGLKGLRLSASRGMGVVIMEPLRGGGLTNNIPENIQKAWRVLTPERTPADWCFTWLWDQPEVGIVLSGMTKPKHVDENLKIADRSAMHKLKKHEKDHIKKIRDMYHARTIINCTGCAYCMPCPHNVDIPNCFQYLNLASMINNWDEGERLYKLLVLDKGKGASNCVACGECLEKCPQRLPIPETLKLVVEKFE